MAFIDEISITSSGFTGDFERMIQEVYDRLIEFIEQNEGVSHYDGSWEITSITGEIDDPARLYWDLTYITKVSLIDQYGSKE